MNRMAPIHEKVVTPASSSAASNNPVTPLKEQQLLRVKNAAREARKAGSRTSSISGPDQYKDGVAASVWEEYIGENRESRYREWLISTLRKHGAVRILDVACGTGVDSRMLVSAGFHVTSCDLSNNMLQKARDTKAKKNLKNWEIHLADWCKLPQQLGPEVHHDFDAVICMGNSFAHLPDELDKQEKQELAISNFREMLRPGGILIIDHRNFDYIVANGKAPSKNIYYQSTWQTQVDTSFERNDLGEVTNIILDYAMTVPLEVQIKMGLDLDGSHDQVTFQLTYFPHYLSKFSRLLRRVFGLTIDDATAPHDISGDFLPLDVAHDPAYYIHVITKEKTIESSDGCER